MPSQKTLTFLLSSQPDLQPVEFVLLRIQSHFLEFTSGIMNLTCQETDVLAELQCLVMLQIHQ